MRACAGASGVRPVTVAGGGAGRAAVDGAVMRGEPRRAHMLQHKAAIVALRQLCPCKCIGAEQRARVRACALHARASRRAGARASARGARRSRARAVPSCARV